jgi:hypothetical protein
MLLLPDTEVEFAGHAAHDLTSTSASAVTASLPLGETESLGHVEQVALPFSDAYVSSGHTVDRALRSVRSAQGCTYSPSGRCSH